MSKTYKIAPKFKRLYCPIEKGSIEALVANSELKTKAVVYEAFCFNNSCALPNRVFSVEAYTILYWMKKNPGKSYRPFTHCKDCFGKAKRSASQAMPANVNIEKPGQPANLPALSQLETPKTDTASTPVFIRVKTSVASVFSKKERAPVAPQLAPEAMAARISPSEFLTSVKAKLSRPKHTSQPKPEKSNAPKKPGLWALSKTRMKYEGETVCLRFKSKVSFSSGDESGRTEEGICVAYGPQSVTIMDKGAEIYEARTYAHEDIAHIALIKPTPENKPEPVAILEPVTV